MSKSTLTITPYLRSNYVGKNGKSSIMIRIILNGERVQFSSKLEIEVDKWDAMQGKIAGRSTAATELNRILDSIKLNLRFKITLGDYYLCKLLMDNEKQVYKSHAHF